VTFDAGQQKGPSPRLTQRWSELHAAPHEFGAADEAMCSGDAGRSSPGRKHSFDPAVVSAPTPQTKPGAQGATPLPTISSGMHVFPCVLWHLIQPSLPTTIFPGGQQKNPSPSLRQCSPGWHASSVSQGGDAADNGEGLSDWIICRRAKSSPETEQSLPAAGLANAAARRNARLVMAAIASGCGSNWTGRQSDAKYCVEHKA